VIVECPRREPIEIAGGRVESTAGPSLSVRDGEAEVRSIVLTRAGGAGLVVSPGAKARVVGGRIVGNRRAGVFVNKGAGKTVVSRVAMGSNGGAGIDLAPAGVSPKAGPGAPKVVYDKKKAKLRGTACRGCTVELFESEDGDKIGNKGHGEGIRLIGVVKADGQGRFVFPQKGDLDCPPSGLVTATATHTKTGTSEFSPDVECSCIVSRAFGLDPQSVPQTGFANFGLAVVFEPGTKIGAIELEDTKTDKRPGPNDLGPELAWSELHNESPRTPGRPLFDDFFVNVGYRRESTTPATGPVKVWRYRVAYDPPRAAKGRCRAVVEHVNLPPPRG
jgi:hypothetical protein